MIITAEDMFDFLGITAPTATQSTQSERIVAGVIADLKSACRWNIDQKTITEFLPAKNAFHENTATTAAMYGIGIASRLRRTQRLQLSSMYVTEVESVNEDWDAKGGDGPDDFPDSKLLTEGVDYFLDKDKAEESISWGGALIRVGRAWNSVPRSVKCVYKSGFEDEDYDPDGVANALREFALNKAVDRFIAAQQKISAIVGPGGTIAANPGMIQRERLGDYDVSMRSPFESATSVNQTGFSESDNEWLTGSGFVFFGVSV